MQLFWRKYSTGDVLQAFKSSSHLQFILSASVWWLDTLAQLSVLATRQLRYDRFLFVWNCKPKINSFFQESLLVMTFYHSNREMTNSYAMRRLIRPGQYNCQYGGIIWNKLSQSKNPTDLNWYTVE